MKVKTVEPSLVRADAPHSGASGGFFTYATTHLRGQHWIFWTLLVYLFVSISAADEEWAALGRMRLRFFLGSFLLLASGFQILTAAIRSQRGPAPPNAVTTTWGAYLVATLLATIWAYDAAVARETMITERFAPTVAFVLLVTQVRTRRQFLLVLLVFCLAYALYLFRSYTEFFAGRVYAKAEGVRMIGMGLRSADPNSFAATLAFSMPLMLWIGVYTRSWLLRICIFGYAGAAAIAVVLTQSRSGLILLAMLGAFFIWLLPGRRSRTVAVLLVLTAAVIGSFFVPERTMRRYLGMAKGGATEAERKSTEGRIEGYHVAFQIFRERPLLGVGPGNWYLYRMRRIDGQVMMPHNLLGQVLATLGLVGTAAFALYLLASMIRVWRENRRRRSSPDPWDRAVAAFAGAMGFTLVLLLVSGLAAHNLGRDSWYWAPALLLVASTCRPEEDTPSGPSEDTLE